MSRTSSSRCWMRAVRPCRPNISVSLRRRWTSCQKRSRLSSMRWRAADRSLSIQMESSPKSSRETIASSFRGDHLMTDQGMLVDTAPPAQRGRAIPYKWELIALLWLAYFFNRADKQLYNCIIPDIGRDLHLTAVQLGLVASIFNWTYGLLVPFGGYFGDLLRRKWVIAISVLLWSATTVLTGFSGGLISLIILRSLATGAGESFYYPSATSLIGQFHHRTRALAMSIHQTALYVGVVVSGLLVGWIAQTYGWRHSFYVFGIAGVVLGIVM